MVPAIIPAAGSSVRMRFAKGALMCGGVSLAAMQVRALQRRCGPIVVVLGWSAGAVEELLPQDVLRVRAPRWWSGSQLDSVRLALELLPSGRVLVQPVDVPPVTLGVLDALLAHHVSAVPTWRGQRGHPVLLGPREVERALHERPEEGLRGLLDQAREVPVGSAEVCGNLNHPRSWARWLRGVHLSNGG